MIDVLLEIICALFVGSTLLVFIGNRKLRKACNSKGCYLITAGFALLFFGTLIDITDNFPELNYFVVIGDTPVQAILEKVIGFLLGFVLLFLGFKEWLPTIIKSQELAIQQLKRAEQDIDELKGLLPICASCKKIRDDKGYWQTIEKYVSDRSDADFSHGICPDCAKNLFPDD